MLQDLFWYRDIVDGKLIRVILQPHKLLGENIYVGE